MPFTVEVESPVAADRMFKAAVLDWHNLGPKLIPEVIASGTGVEGEGARPGSVRQLNFTSGMMPFRYVKERLDAVDLNKLECKSTLVEGGQLGTKLESASAHYKIEPRSSGGSVCKVVTQSKLRPGVDAGDDEAKAKEALVNQFKTVEAYLLANPDAYA